MGGRETYDVDRNNLTRRLLDLTQLAEEVPEAGLGNDIVGGKDAHAVELGLGLLVRRELAANDLVLLEATHDCRGEEGGEGGRAERRGRGEMGGASDRRWEEEGRSAVDGDGERRRGELRADRGEGQEGGECGRKAFEGVDGRGERGETKSARGRGEAVARSFRARQRSTGARAGRVRTSLRNDY